MNNNIISLLESVFGKRSPDFSGIGIIVTNFDVELPITNLRNCMPDIAGKDVATVLSEISSVDSEFHDGFHVLTEQLEIQKVSQFFSPPIAANLEVDRKKRIGGRYMAALYGSLLEGVIVCAIVSNSKELCVFENGVEIYSEKLT